MARDRRQKAQLHTAKEPFPTRLSLILYFLRGCKGLFAISILFAILVSVLDLVNPKIIGYLVDSVLDEQPSSLPAFVNRWIDRIGGPAFLREHLIVIAAAVVVIACVAALCRYLNQLLNSIAAEKMVRGMRDRLFDHILHLPYAWHGTQQTGDIIQRCTSDVEMIKRFLSEQLTHLFTVALLLVMAFYFMIGINPQLSLAAAIFLPVIVGYSLFFHGRIGDSFEKVDEQEGRLSAIAQENLTGVRVVRAFGRELYERERFETQNKNYTAMWVELMRLMSVYFSVSDMISGLQILTVTALGAVLCVHGQMTAGSYIAFVFYNSMLTWPVRSLGRIISEMSKAGISIDRIRFIMNADTEHDWGAVRTPLTGDICFEHVSFSFDTSKVLDDVSFTVPAGSTLGILGSTGSGKSTIAQLLDRLYELPEGSGRITVGNVDIADIERGWLRQHIGLVMQEPYLFSRTLAENIAIAQPEPSAEPNMAAVRDAAATAQLHETVQRFTKGYETFVGERGVTLSGGQKQRAAIAQTLIRRTPIMIFDDSLSAVDAETDARIRAGLAARTQNVTTILIAHRITTLMNADHILVLDKGRIAEEGSHDDLLARNGIYKKIYDLQTQALSDNE